MTQRRFDLSLLAIAVLLTVQATIVSYGLHVVRDTAVETHQALTAAAHAGR